MAKFDVTPPDELMTALSKMGDIDKIAPRMLEAGILPVESSASKGANRYRRTGQMADSVVKNKPKKGKDGWGCSVTFKGKDKKTGVRNAQKAFVIEYGKSGQSPQPFVRPAVISAEKEAVQSMQEVFEYESELAKIKV